MRRLAFRQVKQDLVDITPAPALRRVKAFDDGMAGGLEMRRGVLVGRIVAAADMAAAAADAQVQPAAAALQALFTTERARCDVLHAGNVAAPSCCHQTSAVSAKCISTPPVAKLGTSAAATFPSA